MPILNLRLEPGPGCRDLGSIVCVDRVERDAVLDGIAPLEPGDGDAVFLVGETVGEGPARGVRSKLKTFVVCLVVAGLRPIEVIGLPVAVDEDFDRIAPRNKRRRRDRELVVLDANRDEQVALGVGQKQLRAEIARFGDWSSSRPGVARDWYRP